MHKLIIDLIATFSIVELVFWEKRLFVLRSQTVVLYTAIEIIWKTPNVTNKLAIMIVLKIGGRDHYVSYLLSKQSLGA